jgi:4-amino-4-deoxy-L-arabinose transferase-like glycosyltransferase
MRSPDPSRGSSLAKILDENDSVAMTDSNSRNRAYIFLLFVFALTLRITGLLGFVYGDEEWGNAVRVLAGELSPKSIYPPLFYYLCAAGYAVMFAFGRLVGIWYSTADFRAQYFANPTPFIFTGRLVSAILGALSVPLAVMIARGLSLSRRSALLVGLLVCLLPNDVYYSHIGKSDPAAATAVLLLAWSVLRKLDEPDGRGVDALIGASSALAVSFKQTSVFLVLTLIAGMVVALSWGNRLPMARIARGLLVAGTIAILAYIPMNIGIFLDLKNFLEYQAFLRQMYTKSDPIAVSAHRVLSVLSDNWRGMTIAGLAAGLLAVCVRRDSKFLLLWIAAVTSIFAIAALSGSTLRIQYLLPAGLLLYTLGCVAVATLVERKSIARWIGLLATMAILCSASIGSFQVAAQLMKVPTKFRVGEAIMKFCRPERDKILSITNDLGLPISAEALKHDRDRVERLSKKYGVELPTRPVEKIRAETEQTGGWFIGSMPFVMGGLENLRPEEVKVVKAYGWPIQHEEWQLDHWISQGFNIYIIDSDVDSLLRNSVDDFRLFFTEITQRCELMEVIPSARPLVEPHGYAVYKLRAPLAR